MGLSEHRVVQIAPKSNVYHHIMFTSTLVIPWASLESLPLDKTGGSPKKRVDIPPEGIRQRRLKQPLVTRDSSPTSPL